MKASDAAEVFAYFAATFTRAVPEAAKPLWIEQMEGISVGAAKAAIDTLAADAEYPPPPQRVRKIALELSDGGSQATRAWSQLMGQIESVGTYRHREPQIDDKTWRIVHLMGGWEAACLHDPTKPWFRNEFERLWEELGPLVGARALPGPESEVGELVDKLFEEEEDE